jgi:hypothetical protein
MNILTKRATLELDSFTKPVSSRRSRFRQIHSLPYGINNLGQVVGVANVNASMPEPSSVLLFGGINHPG